MIFIKKEYSVEEVSQIAQQLLDVITKHPSLIFTFKGPIGAGKTTLIKSMLRQSGITDPITSPTFTYVCCYLTKDVRRVYHFDLYRIGTLEQFESMGFDEYMYEEDALVFIEWPSVLANSVKRPICAITLDYAPVSEKRAIQVTLPEGMA